MLNFLNLNPQAFGIDISDLSIKIVKLKKKRRGFELACFGEVPVKQGIINKGEIKKEDALIKIIKKAISKQENLKTPYAIVSLPEEKAFLKVIQMPKMKSEELKEAIYFEAENYIPLSLEKVCFDFQVVPAANTKQTHLEVLVAALPKTIVEPYVSCLKEAGVRPVSLEIESSAITRALIKQERSRVPILLIDLGLTRTSFIVFSGNSLRFTSSISISSKKFTEAISQFLDIDLKKAEKLKIKYGLLGSKKVILRGKKDSKQFKKEIITENKIFEALIPILTNLTKQIRKYLDFYRSHASQERLSSNGKGVEKILLCGGGAYLKELDIFLSSELNLPVEIGNPWINISKQPLLPPEKSLKYTTAIGLALRGIRS